MQDVRPAIQKAKRERATRLGLDYSDFLDNQLTDDWNYFVFPNLQMGIHPEGLSFLYFRPHKSDPRKFIFDVIVMVHPQDDPEVKTPAYMGLREGDRRSVVYGKGGSGGEDIGGRGTIKKKT